jgi:hypothetical protein
MLRPKTFPAISASCSTADACFDAMVRHSLNKKLSVREPANGGGSDLRSDSETLTDDTDLAWGAHEVAVAMFGFSPVAGENRRRRRRVFTMYEAYRKALAEAMQQKRALPANPGWVILPRCARIILSRSAYQAFLAAQLGGGR